VFKSDNLKSLPAAFIKLQTQLDPIKTDAKSHNSKYASLAAVIEAIKDPLAENEFVLFHTMRAGGANTACMEIVLLHASGEHISITIEVPIAKQNDPQAYGSAMTYGRRYSIMALLGLVTEDDDGQSASVTLEDKLKAILDCGTIAELTTAAFQYDNKPGSKVERMAIRASIKELILSKVQDSA